MYCVGAYAPTKEVTMKLFSNVIIESVNGKVLIGYGEDGLKLPKVKIGDNMTIKSHIISLLISIGITDIVEDDLNLYNFEDTIDNNEHIMYTTYIAKTKSVSVRDKSNYKFITQSSLKDGLEKFRDIFDSFVLRLFIINPYN